MTITAQGCSNCHIFGLADEMSLACLCPDCVRLMKASRDLLTAAKQAMEAMQDALESGEYWRESFDGAALLSAITKATTP